MDRPYTKTRTRTLKNIFCKVQYFSVLVFIGSSFRFGKKLLKYQCLLLPFKMKTIFVTVIEELGNIGEWFNANKVLRKTIKF